MKGNRGQTFLRDLLAALDVMPDKELIAGELVNDEGDCCAIVAVCKARGVDTSKIDYEYPEQVGEAVGIAKCMAAEIEYMNDEWTNDRSPQERWIRMRKWVESQIIGGTQR